MSLCTGMRPKMLRWPDSQSQIVHILLLPILGLFSLGNPSVPVSRSPRGFSQPLQDKHVSSPISFYSAGPPDRSKIVIFDLPDQPFNIRSKRQGLPCVLLCHAHHLPSSFFPPSSPSHQIVSYHLSIISYLLRWHPFG
jgi:hypothetical protein